LAVNLVEQVSVAILKQNNTSIPASAKKAGRKYQNLRYKETSKVKGFSKIDTIEISEEGKALAGLIVNKNSADTKG